MLQDIQAEHLDEVEFLFAQRTLAFRMLDLDGHDLRELDGRLCAHLDAVLMSSDEAWNTCEPALRAGPTDRAFAAGVLAFESGDEPRIAAVAAALPEAIPEAARGIAWAASLARGDRAVAFLAQQLDAPDEVARFTGLGGLTFRRRSPGEAIGRALQEGSWPLGRAALESVGIFRLRDHAREARERARSDDPLTRATALEALVLLDGAGALEHARRALSDDAAVARVGARLLGIGGDPADLGALVAATEHADPAVARAATLALGNLGSPDAIDTLLALLDRPERAGVAGVALRRLVGPGCPDVEVERAADDEKDWEPDDDLPLLSREAVERWLATGGKAAGAGGRTRDGRPLEALAPRDDSPLELQLDEAVEAALASPGDVVAEPRRLRASGRASARASAS